MTALHRSRRQLLLASAFSLAPLSGAWAQAAGAAPTGADVGGNSTESIVVTGSRLRTTNATSENPVTIVSAEEIAKSSAQTVEDVLNRLPAIGTSGIYGTTNNGGEGASCTDIRNLGINRVLVLVNGRRFVHTGQFGFDCVDLNNIPIDLIDRIEILKDGASAIYGADAVSGVVNIILKRNFTGTRITADGLISGHGDDRTGDLSATTGYNFDKGNVVVNLEYTNREPVQQASRSWAVPVISGKNLPNKQSIGSGVPTTGRTFDASNSSGSFLPFEDLIVNPNGTFRPYNPKGPDLYDYGRQQYLSGGLEKESFTGLGSYEFNPNITGYLETYFTHKITQTQLAPQPVTGGLDNSEVPDAYIIPAGNPYLVNLFGPTQGPLQLLKRVGEFGDRINQNSADTFQITGGFRGSIGWGWDYDSFFTYGESDATITSFNEVNFQRLENEAGFRYEPAVGQALGVVDPFSYGVYDPSVCPAADGCVLSNPFGQNSLSPAAVNYARFTEVATSTFTLRTFGGSVTNNDVYDLPYGPLGISLGAEHRRESGLYAPDNLVSSGVTLENAQQRTQGAFDVTEIFGEAQIPIVKDLPGLKDLHIDLGGRWFDYNTFGSGESWKAGFNYTPVTGIRFRGNIGEAFRQPEINELFGGQALSFNQAQDPCSAAATYGKYTGNVIAKCLSQGVNPATFQQTTSQIQTITGGNPSLLPETAKTETIGAIISPPFLPRFDVSVDYFRYRIRNTIGALGTQDLLDGCYTGTNPQFCSAIGPRAALQQISDVTAIDENLGELREDGLDIGTNYTYLLPPGYGSLVFSGDLELLFEQVQQLVPNQNFVQFAGTLTPSASGPGVPRQRATTSLAWNYNDLTLNGRMRYISGFSFYPPSTFVPGTNLSTSAPEIFYFDVSASYAYRNMNFTFGIDNIADKNPPFVFDAATNTDPSVYDVLGRVFYIKTAFKF